MFLNNPSYLGQPLNKKPMTDAIGFLFIKIFFAV